MSIKAKITYKQVGRNLNINLEGDVITKVGTKEELAPIKEALLLYNEKPLKKNLQAIKDLLRPVTKEKEKQAEITKAEIKRTKRAAKTNKIVKGATETSIVSQIEASIKAGKISKSELEKIKKLVGYQEKQKMSEPSAIMGKSSRGEY